MKYTIIDTYDILHILAHIMKKLSNMELTSNYITQKLYCALIMCIAHFHLYKMMKKKYIYTYMCVYMNVHVHTYI